MKLLQLLAILLLPSFLFAQGPIFEKTQQAKSRSTAKEISLVKATGTDLRAAGIPSKELTEGLILELDLAQINALQSNESSFVRMTFPMPDQSTVSLDLVENKVLADDFIFRKSSSEREVSNYTFGKYYHGIINNDPTSLVSISVFKNEIIGLISNAEGNFVIGKLKGRSGNKHIIYNDRDLVSPNTFECSTEDDGVVYTREQLEFEQNARDAGDCIRVYIEIDDDIVTEKGGAIPATNYITGLFNEVITLYANDGASMNISEIKAWDTPAPYPGGSSSAMLASFQANTDAFNGDLSHLVSYSSSGGIAAGFNGLCNPNPDYSKCFSDIFNTYAVVPTYSWSVDVCAHEMGHLLGLRHTHACVWNGNGTAIDACSNNTEGTCPFPNPQYPPAGGTIMSYCHLRTVGKNLALGFGPQPKAVLLNNITEAVCLYACGHDGPTCTDGLQNGDETGIDCGGSDCAPCPGDICTTNEITLFIQLDNYPEETRWKIRDDNNQVVATGGNYYGVPNSSTISENICLDYGCYSFTIYDEYGDGICCTSGNGSYTLTDENNVVLATGSDFGSIEMTNFCFTPPCGLDATCNLNAAVQSASYCDYGTFLAANPFKAQISQVFSGVTENPCGTLVMLAEDNYSGDVCPLPGISVNRVYTLFDDLNANQMLDVGEESLTCEENYEIQDNTVPVASCQDITISLNDGGTATITANSVDNNSSDNCGIASKTIDVSSFDCSDVGPNTVTLTVTDHCGNFSACTATVTVEDNIPPMITCQDVTIQLDANGESGFNPLIDGPVLVAQSDNCGLQGGIFRTGPATFTCAHLGDNSITIFKNDINGNQSTCVITLTVADDNFPCNQPPVAVCQDITVYADNNCQGTAVATDFDGGSSDPNNDPLTFSVSPVGVYALGQTAVTLTVTDDEGEQSSCTATVTVEDVQAPVVLCQDITVTRPINGNIMISPDDVIISASDNCGVDYTYVIPNNFSADGDFPVTVYAVDHSGIVGECNLTVTVVPECEPPVINCPDNVTVECTASTDPSNTGTATASGGCGNLTFDYYEYNIPGACPNERQILRVWTVVDEQNFQDSCYQSITVYDSSTPIPPAAPADLNVTCASEVPPPVSLTANDNCDGDITVSPTALITPGACLNDFIMVRTWTFTDACGNSSSVNQTITVLDEEAPVAPAPPADLNLQCFGDVPPPVSLTATDNCDGNITVNPTTQIFPGNCLNDYTMVRTWTFTDTCGNTSSVSQTITVQDNTAPVAPVAPADLNLQCADDVPAPVSLTAIDNCDGNITVSPTDQVIPGPNPNYIVIERTWTFTDGCGNTSSVSQTITKGDMEAYVIISEESMEIEETVIHSGGIGVLNEDEEAKIDDNSMVIAVGTFVKAPEVVVKDGSIVNTVIEEMADPCLPDFLSNFSGINNDVEVEEGETVILDEIYYDDIEAEEGATLIFSGHGNVYIEDFIMDKNVTVIFDQCTNLRVKEDFELGKGNVFNNEGQNVGVYAGFKIEFKGRNIAKGLFYSLGDLIVQSGKSIARNQLYGQFIGEEVEVEKYTDMYFQNFTPCALPMPFIELEQEMLAASQYGYDLENETEIMVSKPDVLNIVDLSVSPNPFNAETNISFKLDQEDYVTVEIYNLDGQLINPLFSGVMAAGSQQLDWKGDTQNGNKLQNGIYLVILKTNEQVITKKVSLIK